MAAGSVTISVTPELQPYLTAQEIRITMTVRDINGVVATPGNLSLRIRRPDDTEVVYTLGLGQLLLLSTGVYYYDLLIDLSYQWRFRAEASGGVDAADEHELAVFGSVFSVAVSMPVPGSGHEGEIARVTGGVYQPYAGTPGQVLGWVAGVGWTSVTVAGLPGAAAAPVNSLQWNNAGAFDGTASILVRGVESSLGFYVPGSPGTPIVSASSFLIGSYHGAYFLGGRNAANTGDGEVVTWGVIGTDVIGIGDIFYTAGVTTQMKAGGKLDVNVAGTVRARWGAAGGNFSLDNLTFGSLAVASGAWVRFPNNTNGVAFRRADNLADVTFVGIDGTNEFILGDTNVTNWYFLSKTGASFIYQVNGVTEYSANATVFDFKDNSSQWGTNPASTGTLRLANLQTIYSRNAANTQNIRVLEMGDSLSLGDGTASGTTFLFYDVKTAGAHVVRVNNSTEYQFDSSNLTMNGNNLLMGAGFASFGATPAGAGSIRLTNNSGAYTRNAANTGNLQTIVFDNADNCVVGDQTGGTAVYLDSKTAGTLFMRFGSTQSFRFDTAKMFIANTSAAPGDPTGGGHIYEEAGALKHRGSSSTVTTLAAA